MRKSNIGHISFKQRCNQLGVNYWRALKRREAGMPEEKIFLKEYVRSNKATVTAMTVFGISYPNLRAACRALQPLAHELTIKRWIKNGMRPEEAFNRIPNPGYQHGVIYVVTHKDSGRQYVGLTVQTMERRWLYHQEQSRAGWIRSECSLHAAIRKYGASAFEISVIDHGTAKMDLEAKERKWIRELGTMAPHGFNIDPGGVSGGSNAKPQVFDGIAFPSIRSKIAYISGRFGISYSAAAKRHQTGRIDVRKPARAGESLVKSKPYKAWSAIVHGSVNPNSKHYKPGLEVHPCWLKFEDFLRDVGWVDDPSLAFARVDKSKGYVPSNCRWMTKSEASQINAAYMKASGRLTGRSKATRTSR